MTGKMITFEGIDGAGKSTHIEAVVTHLRRTGLTVVQTREPGGTPLAETLRGLLLQGDGADPKTELLLMFAARQDHLSRVILPALGRGEWVVCDRFTDASFAYQGASGLESAQIAVLEAWVQAGFQPSRTYWFDVPPAVAASRRAGRGEASDRFEQESLSYFEIVSAGYRQRWQGDLARVRRLDATQSIEAIRAEILSDLAGLCEHRNV